ncbi:hypothetical protein JAAARDRAFT_135350 [Jaapia argillacea MUCL 33604]|uniref:Heme haloperoxidase family profile domain-containing protein n=1 Tax=Jaapia argillacea MUCL 33604 TaxID=933084 RepID=A0A067PTQ8_9AGAM|nr:hypothetical protein JAAARDRAFT_135350 [Jaapia argillacea MUCL 33604]
MSTPGNLGHEFRAAGVGDSRAPCPALNTLANHGYLPRDGKNITFSALVSSLGEVYNLSYPLSTILALSGIATCGSLLTLKLESLSDLALHNAIEHDASLVHADATPGSKYAPTGVDKKLLEALLAACPHNIDGFRLEDLAGARVRREGLLPPGKKLSGIHAEIGRGEAGLTWLLMRDDVTDGGVVPKERLEQWYGEERIPDGWRKPNEVVGLVDARKASAKVGVIMAAMQKGGEGQAQTET